MRPFFTYFGGKWRAAPRYPAPQHDLIVEPFAGSAGYALRHHERDVLLIDADPVIAGIWEYLITTDADEIRALPLLGPGQSVDDFSDLAPAARHLIGFWLNKGTARPCKTPSAWMRSGTRANSFWGETIRERIASQVDHIRHWRVVHGTYTDAPNDVATWFIDPPYIVAGVGYRYNDVEYASLADWCLRRSGQVIVCENEGAEWLPFAPFHAIKATAGRGRSGTSREVMFYRPSKYVAA